MHLQLLQEEYTSSIENRYGFITPGNTIRDGTGDYRKAQFCACVPLRVSYTIYRKFLFIQEKKRIFHNFFYSSNIRKFAFGEIPPGRI
jgi:hypothetical protein